jgi:hypothetical protein
VAIGSAEDRGALLADVNKLMTAAPTREIEGWLAELSVIVARRPQEPLDEAVRLTAYASRLAAYPADVARSALLSHRWQFWPTWDELASVCDALASPRRHMVAALMAPPDEPEGERKRPAGELERMREIARRFEVEMADPAKETKRKPPSPPAGSRYVRR